MLAIRENSLVESIEVVAPAMQKEKHSELPAADVEVMRKRDLKSIDEFKKAHSKLGVGVTKEAQDLFNFYKMHRHCQKFHQIAKNRVLYLNHLGIPSVCGTNHQ
eukprot:GHVP01024292.1.p1 GENE.GHVP01024292.1~~GHVP01024292.1.p1  ORF type:complete len:104 (+),score=10.11 GHVP01024292.1:139-450(+)